jgi:4'-phosphopantetheinyl transferase EntD
VIENLLPAGVRCAEAFHDPAEAVLLPEEEAHFENAGPKRRRESATVRHLARQALGQLGYASVPVPRGKWGVPLWPHGVVGSMTHCTGYRAAVATEQRCLASVGIDAEPHAPLREGTLTTISLPQERHHVSELAHREPGIHWDRLLFSAKESVYKAWFPLAQVGLDFVDMRLTFHPQGRSFTASVLAEERAAVGELGVGDTEIPCEFTGRWAVERGFIITAVSVRRLHHSRP